MAEEEAASTSPGKDELRRLIVAAGEELRAARAGGDSGAGADVLARLLDLKQRYEALTGEEFRTKSVKRSRKEAAASGAAPSAAQPNPNPPKRAKQAKVDLGRFTPAADPMQLPPPASSFPPWAPRDFFRFEVLHTSRKPGSRARVGRIHTPHGVIETPCFVPVGTNGALKAVDERQGREAGTQLMFCNTYHLLVHPGPRVVAGAGGLHRFMNHEGPIITDSGGFQVFSLGETTEDDVAEMKRRKVREGNSASLLATGERGAVFRSYHDGTTIEPTPCRPVHS